MYSEAWKTDADEMAFWALVDLGRDNDDLFAAALSKLDRKALIRFVWTYQEKMSQLAALPSMAPRARDLSEDALDDLCEQIVGGGKACFDDIVARRKKIPKEADYDGAGLDIRYRAGTIFFQRYGDELPPNGYDYDKE